MGSIAKTARRAVRELQAEGVPVSLLKVRAYRPFSGEAIREALREAELVVAIDRNCAGGSHGVLYDEIRSALYGTPRPPRVVGVIAGLGGRDVTVRQIKEITRKALKRESPFDREEDAIEWLGLDRARVRDESPQARPVARAG
jgi:pyruvate/2-oxoacid:ferredoxin oxidoreductase alpha subunit